MKLVRTIYVSTVLPGLDLDGLARQAHANNRKHDLSGLLAFDRKYFIQVVEGGREAVSRLLKNIFDDVRHKNMVLLEFGDIEQRAFAPWSMKFVPMDAFTQEALFKYSATRCFDPYAFDRQSALSFLLDMRAWESQLAAGPADPTRDASVIRLAVAGGLRAARDELQRADVAAGASGMRLVA